MLWTSSSLADSAVPRCYLAVRAPDMIHFEPQYTNREASWLGYTHLPVGLNFFLKRQILHLLEGQSEVN